MIVSFGDPATEDVFHNRSTSKTRRFPNTMIAGAQLKLDMLNAAASIMDLRAPPGNRLEMLKGNLKGRYSVRVNDQWRLVFRWDDHDAHDVRLTDYHN